MKYWRITRWVREEYAIEAKTMKEAKENCEDPNNVTIEREICQQTDELGE